MRLQNKIFSGRVNTDADLSVFPDTDLLNAENVSYVIAADGRIAAVKPSKGNRKIPSAINLSGSVVVGSYAEPELDRLYYFLHSPSGAHRIMMFDQGTEQVSLVLGGSFIGIKNSPITGVDKVGDLLYWVQDDEPPKRINVERGLRTYNPTYTSPDGSTPAPYTSPTLEDITLIRAYPAYSPTITKLTEGRSLNLIDDDAFQFAFSFAYRDGEFSVLSPYSRAALHNGDDDTFDAIRVDMDTRQAIGNEVDKVRLHVRLGNTGSFFTIKEWRRDQDESKFLLHNSGSDPLSYTFYNDTNGVAQSEEYSAKLFDSVPISSRALAAAKNRVFLGNNIFGYEKITSGTITASATSGEVGESTIWGTWVVAWAELTVEGSSYGYNQSIFLKVSSFGDDRDGYYDVTSIVSPFDFASGDLPPIVTISETLKVFTLAQGDIDSNLEQYVLQLIPGWDSGVEYEATYNIDRNYPASLPSGDVQVYGLPGTPAGIEGGKSFKTGGVYKIGVVFYDFAGRNSGVYIPQDAEAVAIPLRTFDNPAPYPQIQVTLNFLSSDIPEWATHYQVVRTKNLAYQSFIQGYGQDIQYVGKDTDGNWQFGDPVDTTVFSETFDSEKVQGIAINISPAVSFGLGYSFLDGDAVRVWTATDRYDFEVIDTVGSYVIVQGRDIGSLTAAGVNHVFEVFTPRRGFLDETFYEIGHVYPVISPGLPSKSLSISNMLLDGDVYIKQRDVLGGSAAVEVMNPSDKHWRQWITDIGRPNIVILNNDRSVRPNSICYSNVWLAATQVNGLSSFDALDYVDMDSNSGPIRSLVITTRTQEYGSVMLAICETETNSIYLGETRIVDNAGAAILATSGAVIGTINNLRGSYGTVNPESVAVDEGRVYFVDRINGVVVQYAQNGLVPVSQNGMAAFFTEVLYELDASARIWATVDGRTSEYCAYIPDAGISATLLQDYNNQVNPHQARTGMVWRYNPEIQGWDCAQDFMPYHLACINRWVISFDRSDLYLHDADAMTYYGAAFKSLVSFPIGSGAMDVKLPQSVGIASNTPPEWVHVRSEEPYEQSTDLEASEFTHTEAMFYASFLRDRLSPGHPSYEHALLLGEEVRGLYLPIAVRFDQNFVMNGIVIQYDISRGHPMLNTK